MHIVRGPAFFYVANGVFTRCDRRGDRSRDRSPRRSPSVNTV